MLNVVCSKWGEKYSDEYVERLYRQCRDKLGDINFYCISDNTDRIDGVTVVDPPNKSWNTEVELWDAVKLYYFEENFLGVDGHFLALDLDMILLDELTLDYERPTIIWKYWRDEQWFANHKKDRTMVNSSMLFWKQNSMVNYFKQYKAKEDYYNEVCKGGSDNYHQFYGNYDWNYFDEFTVYSYAQGANKFDLERGKHRPAYTACIFNGDSPMIHDCDGWVSEYWRV